MVRRARLVLLSLVAALAIGTFPPSTSTADAATWYTACGQPASIRAQFRDIPCSEIDRAVHEAAVEFHINEQNFREVVQCESKFNPYARRPGSQFRGLTQQGYDFERRHVPRFDNDPKHVDLGKGMPGYRGPTTGYSLFNPFHNARNAARVISIWGYAEWQCKP